MQDFKVLFNNRLIFVLDCYRSSLSSNPKANDLAESFIRGAARVSACEDKNRPQRANDHSTKIILAKSVGNPLKPITGSG